MAEIVGLSLSLSCRLVPETFLSAHFPLRGDSDRDGDSDSDGYWPRSERRQSKVTAGLFFLPIICAISILLSLSLVKVERERGRRRERAVATEIELQWSVRFVISATAPQVIRLPSPLSIIIPMQRSVTDGGRHSAAARFINFASASL